MSQTVKQFVTDAYQLISANSPTVPLQGNDMLKGVQFLNELKYTDKLKTKRIPGGIKISY